MSEEHNQTLTISTGHSGGRGRGRAAAPDGTGRPAASGTGPTVLRIVALLTCLLAFSTSRAATAVELAAAELASPDQQFVDGLLARQLFSLAEAHCTRELARTDLSERRRAELSVELARTHALLAISLPSATRDVAWQAAFDALTSFREKHPTSAYLALIRRQEALVHRARGDLLRQEAEVLTTAAPRRQQARAELRAAIAMLGQLLDDLSTVITEYRRPARGEPPRLTEDELRNLREEARYQLARALVSQGLTYPAGSTDRTNSIVRAKQQYAPLAERDAPIDWNSRLALARCDRLLQTEAVARQRLAPLIAEAPPRIAAAARLERARLDYDVGRPAKARQTLQQRTTEKSLAAEWDYEFLRTLLALRAAEKDPQTARRLEQSTNDLVRTIEKQHGPYWLRRAEALLGRHIAGSPESQDAEMLARAAANFYRSDKPDEAIATYDRAAELARTAGGTNQAFNLAFTAASIEHRRQRYEAARDRYRRVAMAQPQHQRAAQAHLLAAFNAAQLVRGGKQGALDEYVEVLEEHLATWPEAETAAQTHIWLGDVRRARRDWAAANKHYRAVSSASPLYPSAMEAIVKNSAAWLASFQAKDPGRRQVASQMAAFYTELLLAGRGELPQPLNELQRMLLLAWARTRMVYLHEGYDEMELMLRSSLNSAAADATEQWKASAHTLFVLALAGQPRRLDKASEAATQLTGAEGEDLIRLVLALNVLREKADGAREQALAELQLAVVDQFEQVLEKAEPAVRRRLNLARAAALVEAKRFDKARERYAELVKEYPDDGDVQRRYAAVLSHPSVATDKAAWQAALQQWRTIEHRSGKATPAWFDAKYHQALAHHRMGNSNQALRIIKLTSALHPELGGQERKQKFEKLKKECGG